MRQVFISYAHEDAVQAKVLAGRLETERIKVVMDELTIGLGQRIADAIGDGIANSNYVVLLASPESMTAEWVRTELAIAMQYEIEGKLTLIIVMLRPVSLPFFVRPKLYLALQEGKWDDMTIGKILDAVQPNIFLQAGKHRVGNFAGEGGSCQVQPVEEGSGSYKIELEIPQGKSFAGVYWEPMTGGLNVANYTHFRWYMRAHPTGGVIQVKFETKGPWLTHRVPLVDAQWSPCQVEFQRLGIGDWEHLERITFAMDHMDIAPGREIQTVEVRGFEFSRDSNFVLDDPVLAELWDNERDAAYDKL